MIVIAYTDENRAKILSNAEDILRRGGIVAYATESFYALGVMATDADAVKRLFKLKKRPADKPLPLIVGSMDILKSIINEVPAGAEELMDTYWPGPLTLVFDAGEHVPALLTGGTGNVAVRIPGESTALFIAQRLKLPVTATSANLSGGRPAKTPEEIIDYFGDNIDLIIDAGISPGGKPSTIIDVTFMPVRILREGRVIPG